MEARTDDLDARPGDGKTTGGWKISAAALMLALLTAILTGAVTYAYSLINDIRKTKLDFVNAQIEKLYGPLYAASQAGDAVWKSFGEAHWRYPGEPDNQNRPFFTDENPPSVDQVRRWRHWMRTVFQPLNLKMEDTLIANSHLLVGNTVPTVFRHLIAHTEAYKAVIASWTPDDFKECKGQVPSLNSGSICPAVTTLRNTAGIAFPRGVVQCIADDYATLKHRQQDLQNGPLATFWASGVARSPACDDQ